MPSFDYKALRPDGTLTVGLLKASGRSEALQLIQERNLQAVRVDESRQKTLWGGASGWFSRKPGRISFAQLENFTRLLSSLLAAGIPLSRALTILHQEATTPAAAARWKEIHDLVVDGMSLSDAMSRFPQTFPRVYVAMVEAGETGGFLDLVLTQIAEFQSRDKDLRAKVFSATIYPAALLVLSVAVLIFLMVFFIPKFTAIFEGFGANLPILTQIVVGISGFFQHYGVFLALLTGFGAYWGQRWFATEKGRRRWEGWILDAPVLGPLQSRFAMARFCRMLGTLIHSGVSLVDGLNVARKSIGNQILVDAVAASIERVQKGDRLANSLRDCAQLFPGSVIEMISVAEESGSLDNELTRLAEVTEKELDQRLKIAVSLMEPAMLFLIAGIIGAIIISMVLPIFTIQDYIK